MSQLARKNRSRAAASRWLERPAIVPEIHAGNVRFRMKQPENLILRIAAVRDEAFRGKLKLDGDGATDRPGLYGPRRNVLICLP